MMKLAAKHGEEAMKELFGCLEAMLALVWTMATETGSNVLVLGVFC